MHSLVLLKMGPVSKALSENLWLYALYGGLAAGLFEETGRYLTMRFLMKGKWTRENALMYGAGHGGLEAVLILGMASVNNLIYSVMINTGSLVSALSENMDSQQVLESLAPLGQLPALAVFSGRRRTDSGDCPPSGSFPVCLEGSKKSGEMVFLSPCHCTSHGSQYGCSAGS